MRLGFRARLLLILALFAAIPAVVVSIGWGWAFDNMVPFVSGRGNWDRLATSGRDAIQAARQSGLTPAQRAAIDEHEAQLSQAINFQQRVAFLSPRVATAFILVGVVGLLLLAWPTWRVAGHLSRQMSRPVDELVGWADRIAHREALPSAPSAPGAPEFEVLRQRMRTMAAELESGRAKAIEAERLRAFRESSRQFAHELKNPLTPIRFAVARLRRDAAPELRDAVEVLSTEVERLEAMARSFAQFGRLPEGPAADVDVNELVSYTARSTVPESMRVRVDVSGTPFIRGQHDALSRALANVMLNAVEACDGTGEISVAAHPATLNGAPAVRISVTDTGPGIAPDVLARIWDPYVTHKAGGTGLGLAIARQSIEAHGGDVFAQSRPGHTEIGFIIPVNAGLPAITGEWHGQSSG